MQSLALSARICLVVLTSSILPLAAQAPPAPNVEAQRAALKKLAFLTGKWSGKATVQIGGKPLELIQTEEIEYRLDGLLLVVEGKGREPETGKLRFSAFAVITFDEAKGEYQLRAYNDGRKVDSVLESDGTGFAWGFAAGPANVRHVMRLTEKGEWSLNSTVKLPSGQEFNTVKMLLQKQP